MVKYVSTYKGYNLIKISKGFTDVYAILSEFIYKSTSCWYSFDMPRQIETIQISTSNICFYKEVDTWPII